MKNWKQSLMNFFTDAMRISIRACLLIDGILLALFSIWFCYKFIGHSMKWLNRILFSYEW